MNQDDSSCKELATSSWNKMMTWNRKWSFFQLVVSLTSWKYFIFTDGL